MRKVYYLACIITNKRSIFSLPGSLPERIENDHFTTLYNSITFPSKQPTSVKVLLACNKNFFAQRVLKDINASIYLHQDMAHPGKQLRS